jgi:ATP-dependent DNA ligase
MVRAVGGGSAVRSAASFPKRKVRFFTRRGNDWSERLSHIVNAMGSLTDRAMILDGDVVRADAGRPL